MPNRNNDLDNPQTNPGQTGGGPQGTQQEDSRGPGSTGIGSTGTGTSPAFDDETNSSRGQAGEPNMQQEGAWRPTDEDAQSDDSQGTGRQ